MYVTQKKICKDNMKDENDQRTNVWYETHTNDSVP